MRKFFGLLAIIALLGVTAAPRYIEDLVVDATGAGGLDIGTADTYAGDVEVHGGATTGGGSLTIYPGAGVDTETDAWTLDTDTSGDLQLRGIGGTTATGVTFEIDHATRFFTWNPGLLDRDSIWNGDTAEVMRVDASTDRVGIGTASPQTKLHISGADPTVSITDTDSTTITTTLTSVAAATPVTRLYINLPADTPSLMDFDFIDASPPASSAGNIAFRFFRSSNTAGTRKIQGYLGDGTNTETWSIDSATGTFQMDDDLTVGDDATVTDVLTVNGNTTLGNASTDTITHTGRAIMRIVGAAGMLSVAGTQGEIVFNTNDSKFYGCTVTHETAATWSALN